MSEQRFFNTLDDRNNQIKIATREAETTYLLNKKKMSTELLAQLLPQLEAKLDSNNHSHAEYYSARLFTELCCRYNAILPENFKHFQNPYILSQALSNLTQSPNFETQAAHKKEYLLAQLAQYDPKTPRDHEEENSQMSCS